MEKTPVSTLQAIFILSGSTGLLNHVLIIPMILQVVGRDAWVSVLISGAIAFLWIPLLYIIMKKTAQQHLLKWIQQRYGKIVSKLLAFLLVVYMMFVSVVTFKDTIHWTSTSYLPQTPKILLIALFAMLCFYNSYCGIQSIAMTAGLLIPFVTVLGFFIMTGNFPQKDYSLLRPVLEHGLTPVWTGVLYGGAGLVEMMFLVLMQHHLQKNVRFGTLIALLLILTALTLGPLVGAITEFGYHEAAVLRYPAYEEWRLLIIGRYVERVDFLSIYQWLTGAFLRISLSMYMIPELLQINEHKKRSYWSIGAFLVLCVLTLWPLSDMTFLQLLTQIGIPGATIWLGILSLITGALVLFKSKTKAV